MYSIEDIKIQFILNSAAPEMISNGNFFFFDWQVVCAVPHNLESKSPAAPGQSPTGSVCYERNGVNLCIFLKPLPDPPCDL